MTTALAEAARGRKADMAKPFKGVGGGVFEIALKHPGNAFRHLRCADRRRYLGGGCLSEEVKSEIKTPQMDVDRIKERIIRLKETLR